MNKLNSGQVGVGKNILKTMTKRQTEDIISDIINLDNIELAAKITDQGFIRHQLKAG